MDLPPLTEPQAIALVAGALVLLLVLLVWMRLRRRRSVPEQLRQASLDLLANIVVPDGDDGQLHIDYALLTPSGILVLDLRDVEGHVFGSNAMQDWTVLADRRRFTFANPQHALHDRVAAVSRLLPDIEVSGLIAFTGRARFSKGRPDHVALVDELLNRLRAERDNTEAPGLRDGWDRLRSEAVTAQVGRLMRD